MTFCLDEEESHLIGQNLSLAACHNSAEKDFASSGEHISAADEKERNDCTDVSLANANILSRPSKIILPVSTKVLHCYTNPRSQQKLQQQRAESTTSELSHPLFVLPGISAHRTVVLLI